MGHLGSSPSDAIVKATTLLLEDAVVKKIGSGLAASFGNLGQVSTRAPIAAMGHDIYAGRTAHFAPSHPITAHTVFDLASLTKILATTTLAMKRVDGNQLTLDQPISRKPEFAGITIRNLLTHSSGLPAWKPFYEDMRTHFGERLPWVSLGARKAKFAELLDAVPKEKKPDEQVVYSDLGFLHLENFLSQKFKLEVEALWQSMQIPGLHFRPVVVDALTARKENEVKGESFAATELCPWRGLLSGQVHDDNAWSTGGIAGHAGAFGTLSDVKAWVRAVFLENFVSRPTLRMFTETAVNLNGTRRALGFDMPSSRGAGSTGYSFSMQSVGHLGFTGTSVWVDLQSGDYAILLTNRVHPDRNDTRIRGLRQAFHRFIRGR